jgi:hypothetical protein
VIDRRRATLHRFTRTPVASARSAGDTAEVHSPKRIVVNDSVPGDLIAEIVNVVAAGAFTVRVQCSESGGGANDVAGVVLTGPPGSSFSGGRTEGTFLNFASHDSPVEGGRPLHPASEIR